MLIGLRWLGTNDGYHQLGFDAVTLFLILAHFPKINPIKLNDILSEILETCSSHTTPPCNLNHLLLDMLDPELQQWLIADAHRARMNGYLHFAALSLVIYDSLCLIPREGNYLYYDKRRTGRIIYFSIKICSFFQLICASFTNQADYLPRLWCVVGNGWMNTFVVTILTTTLNLLLVVRLRALWEHDLRITIALYGAMACEVLTGFAGGVLGSYSLTLNVIDRSPFHGCSQSSQLHAMIPLRLAVLIIWCCVTALQVALTVIKFVEHLYPKNQTFYSHIAHIRKHTPVIYVFYRDGNLFIFPVLVFGILQYISMTKASDLNSTSALALDWTVWTTVVYYLCVTRLILNLREANCRLTEPMASRQLTTLQFREVPVQDQADGSVNVVLDINCQFQPQRVPS